MKYKEIIGLNIKWYRYQKNITQELLADKTSKDTSNIPLLEKGDSNITLKQIDLFAKHLGVLQADLFNKETASKAKKLPQRVDMYKNKANTENKEIKLELAKIFGYNLKYYRYQKGMRQKELAKLLNVETCYLSTIETGTANITIDNFENLVNKLPISLNELLNIETALKAKTLPTRIDKFKS